jgi:hypothetical protein
MCFNLTGSTIFHQIVYMEELHIIFYCFFFKLHTIFKMIVVKLQLILGGTLQSRYKRFSFVNICVIHFQKLIFIFVKGKN